MKAAAFDYRCATSTQEITELLDHPDSNAKLMAGGQSFGPMLNLRLTRPSMVVDVSRLDELARVTAGPGFVEIGAGVTHAAIEDGRHAALREHPMRSVAAGIAYRAVRNRGTVGGSLAHADPAADWVVTLVALGAQLSLYSPRGTRRVAMDDFMQAAYTTVLAADELITSVRVPQADGGRWGYYKFCRKPGEFAEASAAVWLASGERHARIALGALDGAPKLLPDLAQRIADPSGAAVSRDDIRAAIGSALPEHDAVDRKLFATCVARALAQAGLGGQAASFATGSPA
jgi:aerobic carbon-monoxide dehydrogenase medium subunit